MKNVFIFLILLINIPFSFSQDVDSLTISSIYKSALTSTIAQENLRFLCDSAPGRLIGTEESVIALHYFKNYLKSIGIENISLLPYQSTIWRNNSQSKAIISQGKYKDKILKVDALGHSVSTTVLGLESGVIEVNDVDDLPDLGRSKIEGKIVFFNRKMNNAFINTFQAYKDAINPRINGAAVAAKYGASAVVIRSLCTSIDDHPHTGVTHYNDTIVKIPALSISTRDAENLSNYLATDPNLKLTVITNSEEIDSVTSYNLIGEIKGAVEPEKIIVIGAHIDSWYNSPGAHDDGAGCVQMVDVLRIFKELNIQPKKTIRLVLFMDEELNQSGAEAYAEYIKDEADNHLLAIESDNGGFTPEGFRVDASDSILENLQSFSKFFSLYGELNITKGFAGVDVNRLKRYDVPLIGLSEDSQRYFEYHHSPNDTFDKVYNRELQLGTAALASFVYLVDKYGYGL